MLVKIKKNILWINLCCIILITLSGCRGGYSLTGVSISPDVRTISIQTFPNNALLVQPQLSTMFTKDLRDRFTNQTPLKMILYDGDLSIKGEIIDYSISTAAIQANDAVSLSKLTITVHVKFVNLKDPKANFDKNYSQWAEYNQNLADVEIGLITEINEKLINDIYRDAVGNW